MKQVITALILTAISLVGAEASASTSPLWASSVRSASVVADLAKAEIARTDNCKGLKDLLELGANGSGTVLSGTLGEIRSHLNELDLLAATVQYTTVFQDEDASARGEALAQIQGLKTDVLSAMGSRLKYCGNGVEKGAQGGG